MTGDQTPATYTPAVPERVRAAAYYVALVVGAVTTAATTIAATLAPDAAATVAAIAGALAGVVSTIAGGLGVAYRPTRASYPTRAGDDG